MSEGLSFEESLFNSIDALALKIQMTPRSNREEQYSSTFPAGISFPSTPSPSVFDRRPSAVSSASWGTRISRQSSELSLHGPLTPQSEDCRSPCHENFIPETNDLFSTMNNVRPLQDYSSSFSIDDPRAESFLPLHNKEALTAQQLFGDYQSPLFEDVVMPQLQRTPVGNLASSGYELPDQRSARSHAFFEFSSPMASLATSPVTEGPAPTIMPSQVLTEPSTPGTSTSFSSACSSSRSTNSDSLENMLAYYNPVSSPTPNPGSSKRAHGRWTHTSGNSIGSLPYTPSRRSSRGKAPVGVRKSYVPPPVASKRLNPYKCKYENCEHSFKRQEHLKRHELKHNPDFRPHICPIDVCRKGFSRSDNLKAHVRTHEKQGGRNVYVGPNLTQRNE
ncbi:MAG: hypothetical protein M1817_001131 [Caeruleum heppii]|nr:MAG: hypothetical protein M1817_001131 [Caeruleum heppii]